MSSSKRKSIPSSSSSSSPKKKRPTQTQPQHQSTLSHFFGSTAAAVGRPPASRCRYSDDDDSCNEQQYRLFVDLDGVLVDFERGVRRLFPRHPADRPVSDIRPPSRLWAAVSSTPDFYQTLAWTTDGAWLWKSLCRNESSSLPEILTGVPRQRAARCQKFEWCRRELLSSISDHDHDDDHSSNSISIHHVDMAGPKKTHTLCNGGRRQKRSKRAINVITCWSTNKHCESGPNRVLIDDRAELGIQWEEKGGIFIHHTDTKSTLDKLTSLNILLLKPSIEP